MVTVTNVSKSYKQTRALIDFTYEFDRGIYAILGPNGSGKSTLMNIMTGNLRADAGQVNIDGKNGGRAIGYVPQYPGMYPDFTVYEMLDYTSQLSKSTGGEEEINELIEAFELTEYRNGKVRSLSGGTKQRLAIAQAFIGSPELVILDEPTSGLDPLQRILFKNFIKSRRNTATIIVSTHIVSDVEDVADKVIFLKRGKIERSGSINEIISGFEGECWTLPEGAFPSDGMMGRVAGDRVRVISPSCPVSGAEAVIPTLDDCYLAIFGEVGSGESK